MVFYGQLSNCHGEDEHVWNDQYKLQKLKRKEQNKIPIPVQKKSIDIK